MSWTSYMVIVTVTSRPQLLAVQASGTQASSYMTAQSSQLCWRHIRRLPCDPSRIHRPQYRCREVAREVAGREAQEGKPGKSEWELIDFGDVVVSVMTPEQREYYDLESFYGQAEEIDLPF